MHFTTITTLLLPFLLSSVLAAPTSTTHQVGNPDALIPRLSCADGFGADECDPNDPPAQPSGTCDPSQNLPGTCEDEEAGQSWAAAAAKGEDNGATGPEYFDAWNIDGKIVY